MDENRYPRIDSNKVTEFETNHFCVDSIELGWVIGEWPTVVETDLGNKERLVRCALNSVSALYRQDFGPVDVLVVFPVKKV